jgi:hypothetical protein
MRRRKKLQRLASEDEGRGIQGSETTKSLEPTDREGTKMTTLTKFAAFAAALVLFAPVAAAIMTQAAHIVA